MGSLKNKLKDYIKSNKKTTQLVSASDAVDIENETWLSSGSYALNKLLSGDPRKGWLAGKIHGLAGEPGVGKSFLALSTVREAIKAGHICIVIDTEGNIRNDNLISMGIDPEDVLMGRLKTIEDFKTFVINEVENLRKTFTDEHILVVVDSIGMLASNKEIDDARSGKNAADMGAKAKGLKSASRICQYLVDEHDCTIIVVNHTYTNPTSFVPEQVFAGGSGFIYASTSIVYLNKKAEKDTKVKTDDGTDLKTTSANFITAHTAKNRIVPEGQKVRLKLSFKTGLNKWFGLLEPAIEHGFFESTGARIHVKHLDAKPFKTQLFNDDKFWLPIIDDLSDKMLESTKYHTFNEEALKELEDDSGDDIDSTDVSDIIESDD